MGKSITIEQVVKLIFAISFLALVLGLLFYLFIFKPNQEALFKKEKDKLAEISKQEDELNNKYENCKNVVAKEVRLRLDQENKKPQPENSLFYYGLDYVFYSPNLNECVYAVDTILLSTRSLLIKDAITDNVIKRFDKDNYQGYKSFIEENSGGKIKFE